MKPTQPLLLSLTIALMLSACGQEAAAPAAGDAAAQPPAPAAEAAAITGVSGTYVLDPKHTDVIAQWNHFGFSNPSVHFGQVDGTIVYDADNVAASSVNVTFPLTGLDAYVPAFNAHLRSGDFFEADSFPEITFTSTKVEPAGVNKLNVTGDLIIKGITRPVVLDVTINGFAPHPMSQRMTAGFDATATLKRSDFGLDLYAPNVSDEVRLRITTEAPLQQDADAAD